MRKFLLLTTIAIAAWGLVAPAHAEQKQVGTWLVNTEKDRFGEGDKVIALTTNRAGTFLAVRCLEGGLSFAYMDQSLNRSTGTPFTVKFKGGKHDVINTIGYSVQDNMIEVAVNKDIRSQLLTSDEFAFRFQSPDLGFDTVFPAGTAKAALTPVLNACPLKPGDE